MNTLLITFTGIDGSGKSTISKALVEKMKTRNIDARYLWWFEAENSLFRRFLRISSGTKMKKKAIEKKKLPESSFIKTLYQYMILLDYQRQTIFKVWMPSMLGKTIVCDRYIYDIVVSFAMEFGYSRKRAKDMLSFLRSISPVPDIEFYVDIPPEVALSRKKDIISLEHHKELRKWYLELVAEKMIVLDGTKSLYELNHEVWEHLAGIMEKRRVHE
jgi:thymidylate kinase